MVLTVAILIYLAIVVLLVGLIALKTTVKQQAAITRLESIVKAEKRGVGIGSVDLKLIRDELLSDVPVLNRMLLRWNWATRLQDLVAQAGVKIKPGKLLLISSVLGLCADLGVQHFYSSPLFPPLAGVVAGMLPLIAIAFMRSRRLHAFEKSFPEAIDLLGRAVRAGHAFTTGLEMIATELPQPLSGEFRTAYDEQNFGLPLREALLNLCERVPLVDVRFFVTALLVQKETGGNLAEILDNLSHVIRERFKILGEVRTRTAQGRLTAGILIALPPAMILLLRSVNPDYIQPLFDDPMGPYMLGGAAILQLVGSLLLWKIVRIEV
jgi:tight adherence protein B